MRQFLAGLKKNPYTFFSALVISVFTLSMPGQNNWQTMPVVEGEKKIADIDANIPELGPVPQKKDIVEEPPGFYAASVIALDPRSGTLLYQKNIDEQLLPASTTKIMTALVSLEQYEPDEIVSLNGVEASIGHTTDINSSEKFTVKDLLFAMMVSSGNDAAYALAAHHPQGYRYFVDLMNQKAKTLHLTNTHYSNVSGLESWTHYSSARDLALLAQEALKKPLFRDVVKTQEITITNQQGTNSHRLVNLNQLLGVVEGVQGVKTGWTPLAGECLVTYTVRDGSPLITVVLNSNDRFGESERIIEWVYANHTWIDQAEYLSRFTR